MISALPLSRKALVVRCKGACKCPPSAGKGGSSGSNRMTKEDAARIQSSQARAGKDVGKGSFAARAQSTADLHPTKEDAARIQAREARAGRDVGKGSVAARAQSAADSCACK
ncbi:hypothetical protein TSOC_001372 [Tetrabaena socialis]|uniref:Uncharacterized protein n=1 Tax=Tetrabaena socialis TaxID=47790 RepID=A0A2J8AH04_9CHLO|nr:hypothetical protein TSOC_001372 [Tetrabaena socialis]|eukprot:PNH11791.1 hypothetical protein TSOC_001372 [Tetrabaena socialis]